MKGRETSILSAVGSICNYTWPCTILGEGEDCENNESMHYIG